MSRLKPWCWGYLCMSAPMKMPLKDAIKAAIPEWRKMRLRYEVDEEAGKLLTEIKEKIAREDK